LQATGKMTETKLSIERNADAILLRLNFQLGHVLDASRCLLWFRAPAAIPAAIRESQGFQLVGLDSLGQREGEGERTCGSTWSGLLGVSATVSC